MFKKIISYFLAVCLIFTMLPASSLLANADAVLSGSGTADDPFLITSAADLQYLGDNYANYTSAYFAQTADINLSGISDFTPIGGSSLSALSITYDGCWHTITGLNIISNKNTYFEGLFTEIGSSGSIRNLCLSNVNVNIPGRAEYVGTFAGFNAGTIENCYVTSGSVTGGPSCEVGGIAGGNGGTINSCYNSANVSITSSTNGRLPGAAGIAFENYGNINNCWNSGTITANDMTSAYVGGIAGLINSSNSIVNSYSRAASVTGGYHIGGIAASAFSGDCSSDYFLSTACAYGIGMLDNSSSSNNNSTPESDILLKTASTYSSWDASDTWTITEGSYPALMTAANIPTALTATADSNPTQSTRNVTVKWDKAKRSGGYRIYWRNSTGSYNETNSKFVYGYSATSTTIPNLTNGDTYYFEIKAMGNNQVLSSASNEISVALEYGVGTLSAAAGNAKADLTFNVPSIATSVKIYQSTNETDFDLSATGEVLTSSSTSATVSGLTNGTTYYFRLVATINGTDLTSNIVSCKPIDTSSAMVGPLYSTGPNLSAIPFITEARTTVMASLSSDGCDGNMYGFIPPADGEYTIYTNDPAQDTYLYLTQSDIDTYVVDQNDEDTANSKYNFKCIVTLSKDYTYYLCVSDYNDSVVTELCISGPGLDPAATYDVTFDANGGTPTPSAQIITSGKKATVPATAPTKENYNFSGWYNGDTVWDFDTDTVTGNITLTAMWTLIEITTTTPVTTVTTTETTGTTTTAPATTVTTTETTGTTTTAPETTVTTTGTTGTTTTAPATTVTTTETTGTTTTVPVTTVTTTGTTGTTTTAPVTTVTTTGTTGTTTTAPVTTVTTTGTTGTTTTAPVTTVTTTGTTGTTTTAPVTTVTTTGTTGTTTTAPVTTITTTGTTGTTTTVPVTTVTTTGTTGTTTTAPVTTVTTTGTTGTTAGTTVITEETTHKSSHESTTTTEVTTASSTSAVTTVTSAGTSAIQVIQTPEGIENSDLISVSADDQAFSQPVEIRLKDDEQTKQIVEQALNEQADVSTEGSSIYPLDISLYIKGTDTKVQPKNGDTVEITCPVPSNLLADKEKIVVVCIVDGKLQVLPTTLVLKNGVACIVFKASHFSPYAFVIDNDSKLSTLAAGEGITDNTTPINDRKIPYMPITFGLVGAAILLNKRKTAKK